LSEDSLDQSRALYINVNIFKPEHKDILSKLKALPATCYASSECLETDAEFYQKDGVFPEGTIHSFVKRLRAFDDRKLSERLYNKKEELKELVERYLHCM